MPEPDSASEDCAYSAMIQVASDCLTLEEISARLGMECDPGISHAKGTARGRGYRWKGNYWRLDSREPENAPLAQHLDGVLLRSPARDLLRATSAEGCTVSVEIGVFLGWLPGTGIILPRHIAWMNETGAQLCINNYPSSDAAVAPDAAPTPPPSGPRSTPP